MAVVFTVLMIEGKGPALISQLANTIIKAAGVEVGWRWYGLCSAPLPIVTPGLICSACVTVLCVWASHVCLVAAGLMAALNPVIQP